MAIEVELSQNPYNISISIDIDDNDIVVEKYMISSEEIQPTIIYSYDSENNPETARDLARLLAIAAALAEQLDRMIKTKDDFKRKIVAKVVGWSVTIHFEEEIK